MPWWFEVVEAKHELQNPTSADKIRALGATLGLGPESHVLDMGAGKGGPAILLAQTFGCHVTCVERSEAFVDAGRARAEAAAVDSLVGFVQADGAEFSLERNRYDAALCLGASFIWGGLARTVAAIAPAVRPRGFVAVGEVFWRRWPLPEAYEPDVSYDFRPLSETVEIFRGAGVEPVTLIASAQDDWDRYQSLQWLALDEWLHDHPDDPDAEEFRSLGKEDRDRYLRWERDLLGWAIFVGRTPSPGLPTALS